MVGPIIVGPDPAGFNSTACQQLVSLSARGSEERNDNAACRSHPPPPRAKPPGRVDPPRTLARNFAEIATGPRGECSLPYLSAAAADTDSEDSFDGLRAAAVR